MSDSELMTDIMSKMVQITDPAHLHTIYESAWNRKRDLRQQKAAVETASWKIHDEVQMSPELRRRKPYGAKGKIVKINKVNFVVDFGNGNVYNVNKGSVVKAV